MLPTLKTKGAWNWIFMSIKRKEIFGKYGVAYALEGLVGGEC